MELVSVVEHRMKLTKEGKEMRRPEHWRVEIFVVDDVLDWKLIYIRDDIEEVTDHGDEYVVSDLTWKVGKALEGYLPEIFA